MNFLTESNIKFIKKEWRPCKTIKERLNFVEKK